MTTFQALSEALIFDERLECIFSSNRAILQIVFIWIAYSGPSLFRSSKVFISFQLSTMVILQILVDGTTYT